MSFAENDVTIYCDDKPVTGLEDLKLPAIYADNVPEYISGNSGSISFSAPISVCASAVGICAALSNPKKFIADATDLMLWIKCENPKWWHYYKHSRKTRIRMKYYKRLYRQVFGKHYKERLVRIK